MYTSVYCFPEIRTEEGRKKPVYESAILDKMFFDLDSDNCFENTHKLHKWCVKNDYKHTVVFSGRGFHVYIFTSLEHKLRNKKGALTNAQRFIADKVGLSIGESKEKDLDEKIIGDICRITRIPNTYHIVAKRFCIPLTRDQFEKSTFVELKELATKQNKVTNIITGRKVFDMDIFDCEPDTYNGNHIEEKVIEVNTEDLIPRMTKVPPCVANLLKKGKCNYKERFHIILFLKEKGFMLSETVALLKKYLTPDRFKHCIRDEKQPQYLYRRDDLIFPSCEKISEDRLCPGKCELKGRAVYKND